MLRTARSGRLRAFVVATALAAPLTTFAAEGDMAAPVPPTDEELTVIEEVGWRIARHQEAREKARDRVAGMKNFRSMLGGETVLEGNQSWRVLFLKDPPPQDRRKRPLIMLEVEYHPASGETGYPSVMVPPREAEPRLVSFYRAGQIALVKVIENMPSPGPLELAVFRMKRGQFMGYITSKTAPDGHIRFGGDHVVRVATTGRRIESIEPLHAGPPVDVSLTARDDGDPTLHTHVLLDRPTATDVALVMRHPSLAPHLVFTPHFMYRIDAKGQIMYLGESPLPPDGEGGAGTEGP